MYILYVWFIDMNCVTMYHISLTQWLLFDL